MLVALASKTAPPLKFEEKWIKAKVIKVTFKNVYKCSLKQTAIPISGPHYVEGDKLVGNNYSEKPVVYPIKKQSKVTADVIVNMEVKNMSGTATLRGKINGHVFEGSVPIKEGDSSPITVKLMLKTTEKLQWNHGNIAWTIETKDNRTFMAGKSVTELLFVFDDPSKMKYFKSNGVWAEALRFLYEKASVSRKDDPKIAVKSVTKCCFKLTNHQYEWESGARKFGGGSPTFKLKKYMNPAHSLLNCYDQTYAVIVFSGALGVNVDGLFMKPFGFLRTTDLVGRGPCNNPFPKKDPKQNFLQVPDDDPLRSAFGNHMFCDYKLGIYDACAGPTLGQYDKAAYVNKNVDKRTTLNSKYRGFPGIVSDVRSFSIIGLKILSVV